MASNAQNLTKRRRVATARTSGITVALLATLKKEKEKGMQKVISINHMLAILSYKLYNLYN